MKKPAEQSLDFKKLFEHSPGLYLVLSPELKVVAVSDPYLSATMTKREEIVGRGIFEVFPDNPDDPKATGVGNLHASLMMVLQKKSPDAMAVQKYDIPRPESEGGGFEERFWSPLNSPVLGKNNELEYIIHQVEDVTEFIRLKQRDSEQNKLTQDLATNAEKMEAEIFLRAQQIQLANKKLRDAEIMKDRFLANMSHEIRTPMNAIIGFTDLVAKTQLDPRQKEFVNSIAESGQNLLGIINDILDISKIEAGMIQFENVPFSIRSLTDSVKQLLSNKAESKKIDFQVSYDDRIPELVSGDPTRLTQILVNLLGNALKFTEKGFVILYVSSAGNGDNYDSIKFDVRDSGIGIAADKVRSIFERFTQASADTTRKYGGTGLGLSIVKNLVELQGGEISVDSTPGEGTVFTVTMPFKKISEEELKHYSPESTGDEKIGKLNGTRILLVEDNKMNQRLAVEILAGFGMLTDVAENGKVAIRKIQGQAYDLVLMDMQMQEMDGYQATRIIREELKATLPIIAMTAHAFIGEKDRCLAIGMNDYISKPFKTSELYRKIHHQLKGSSVVIEDTNHNGAGGKTLINLEYLENTIGHKNRRLLTEMIDIFVSEVPPLMNSMGELLSLKDYAAVAKTAHRIYTSVAMVGIDEVSKLIRRIEEKCNSMTDLSTVELLYWQAKKLCKEAVRELKEEKENYLVLEA